MITRDPRKWDLQANNGPLRNYFSRFARKSQYYITFCKSLFLSSADAELADLPLKMLMTLLTALSIPNSGPGEFCLELTGEFLVVEDRLLVLVGFISSAGDKIIWRSLMLEAASASTLAETSLKGDTFNREWELPWTNCD